MRTALYLIAILFAYGVVGRMDADVAEAEALTTHPRPVEIAHAPR